MADEYEMNWRRSLGYKPTRGMASDTPVPQAVPVEDPEEMPYIPPRAAPGSGQANQDPEEIPMDQFEQLMAPKPWVGQSFTPDDYASALKAGGKAVARAGVEALPALGTALGGIAGAAGTAITGPGSVAGGLLGAGLGKGVGTAARNVLAPHVIGEQPKGLLQTSLEAGPYSLVSGAAEQAGGEVVGKALSLGAGKAGDFYTWLGDKYQRMAGRLKPNAEMIEASAKRLGGKASPGMLSRDYEMQLRESALEDSPSVAGDLVRASKEKLRRGMETHTRGLFSEAANEERSAAAEQIKSRFIETISNKLDPLKQKYTELAGSRSNINLDPKSVDRIARNIETHPDAKFSGSDAANVASKFSGWLRQAKTADDVAVITSKAKAITRDLNASGESKRMAGEVIDRLERLSGNTIKRSVIDIAGNTAEGKKIASQMLRDIAETNEGYKELMNVIRETGGQSGAKLSRIGTPKEFIDSLNAIENPKFVDKFFTLKNPKQMEVIKKHFPEEFELLRASKLSQIRDAVVNENGSVNLVQLSRMTKDLEPTARRALFGDDGAQVLDDVMRVWREKPTIANPSGTARTISISKYATPEGLIQEGGRMLQYLIPYRLGAAAKSSAAAMSKKGLALKGSSEFIEKSPEIKGLLSGLISGAD